MEHHDSENISEVVIHLMRGILYKEEKPRIWQVMEQFDGPVRDHLAIMNLDLEIYDSDGFAYLKSKEQQEGDPCLPRIMARRPLSYPVSLMLAILRRKLTEHDTYSSEPRLIIGVDEFNETVAAFFPTSNNEVKVLKRMDAHLQRIHDLGFIRFMDAKKQKFEVKRILKAYIDAQWLSGFNEKLEEYLAHGSESDEGDGDV
ncbi:MAG: DUF4194 domain-containing protein [Sphaerochaeta sp.]|nr:DUF4194 domain-containing protein [Sphaerochaeta sp.]